MSSKCLWIVLASLAPALAQAASVDLTGIDRLEVIGQGLTAKEPSERARLRGHTNEVEAIAITPDGRTLVSGSNDKTVKVWDLATGKERATLRGHTAFVESVAISPDGRMLASGGRDNKIKLWDMATFAELATLAGHTGRVRALAFRPDNKLLASGSNDQTVKLWDLATRKEQTTLAGHSNAVLSIAFAPDGKTLAAAAGSSPVKLWDVTSGKERANLVQNDTIHCVVFSADGKTLAAGGSYDGIRLWELATNMQRASFIGRAPRIRAVAITASGKMLAAASWQDRQPALVELWDLKMRRKPVRLEGNADSISSVAFTPDGKTLAAAEGPDTTIRLWDVSALAGTESISPSHVSEEQLDALWTNLAAADAALAYKAIWSLIAAGPQAAPWISKRVRPVAPAEPQRLAQLIADLDSNRFAARERASCELEKLCESAGPALHKALSARPSPETRRRVQQLLEKLDQPGSSAERLRVLRAIEVLEHIGSSEARQVLQKLATGIPEARVTQEAKRSLDRLNSCEFSYPSG